MPALCKRCFSQIRQASTSAKAAHLPKKSVLEVAGPDAQKFLKGLTSRDVEPLGGGYSGFLNPSGRILHTVFIVPTDPQRYLISHESPPDHPAPLLRHLTPYKLRSKVRIKDVSPQWDVWAAWDVPAVPEPTRAWKPGSGGACEAQWSWPTKRAPLLSEVGCWDLRIGGNAQHLFLPKNSKPEIGQVDVSEYDLYRMENGLPEGPSEIIPGSSFPFASCMDIHGGVDVRKGCYIGQELTVRTYHTGATRRRILPIRLLPLPQAETDPESASEDIMYHTPDGSRKPRSAGRIVALRGTIGLALVRLDMVDHSFGFDPSVPPDEWSKGVHGRLVVKIDGNDYGVLVRKGPAYASALDAS